MKPASVCCILLGSLLGHAATRDLSPFALTEFLVDTSRYYQLPDCYERYPGIAFDSTNFMAVWMDYTHMQVAGTRIAQDGTIMDIPPFTISSFVSDDQPDITFDGTNYFVVWAVAPNIYGARITPSGTVLDPGGILISNTGSYCTAVAYGDGVYLVAWQSTVGQYDALAALVDTSGTVLLNFTLSADPVASEAWPNVAFDGTNFLTVWYISDIYSPEYGIMGSRITPGGTNLDPGGFHISSNMGDMWPVVDFDGTNWFVVWSQGIGSGFARAWVTPGGVPFGEGAIAGSYGMTFPELVLGDSLHWIEAIDIITPNIYATRVDFNGSAIDIPWIAIDTSAGMQAYGGNAYGDSTFIAIWEDQVSYEIYARRYRSDGVSYDSTRFMVNIFDSIANPQYTPSVAFDGTNYLAVYADNRNVVDYDICGSRITASGTLLDPEGFLINQQSGTPNQPRVAFGDSLYLCVWENGADIWGARILPDGTVLDPGGIQITAGDSADYKPSVAYSNGIFLVVFNRIYGTPIQLYQVFGTRITPAGQILDPGGFIIQSTDHNHYSPEVAGYENGFLTTWYLLMTDSKIEGVRVDYQGAVIDSPAIQISPANLGADYAGWHSVTEGNDTFFVVWHRNNQEIIGARVDSSGNVLDPAGMSICVGQANSRKQPSVSFDGKEFMVAWRDSRQSSNRDDIFGARILPGGVVVDTNGTLLVNAAYSRYNIELASGIPDPDSGGQTLLVYDGFVDPPFGSNRALGAFYYPWTGIEENDTQKAQTGCRLSISPSIARGGDPFMLNYSFVAKSGICVDIYDVMGRLVKNIIIDNVNGTGQMQFTLDSISQGVYFARIETENEVETVKIIRIK